MWTHKAWPTSRLHGYAQWCNAVEGNTTFYATPARDTVVSWAAQTSADFRFVVKLPRTITHERRLFGATEELHAFLEAIEPLGPRTHALWLQMPGSFAPSDVPALESFLSQMPASHRCAVEVRHREFFDDPRSNRLLEKVLVDAGAEWIPFDTTVFFQAPPTSHAERETWTKKPRMPRRAIALTDRPIVRYLGRDATAQTVEGWRYWLDVVAQWLDEGRSPTMFIHTPDDADALLLARRFHEAVRARVPQLEALPEPAPLEPPTLF